MICSRKELIRKRFDCEVRADQVDPQAFLVVKFVRIKLIRKLHANQLDPHASCGST